MLGLKLPKIKWSEPDSGSQIEKCITFQNLAPAQNGAPRTVRSKLLHALKTFGINDKSWNAVKAELLEAYLDTLHWK